MSLALIKLKHFVWRYKVTIFFVLTYWVLDPYLYWHFGNAYIAQPSTENKWLVFLAGPFSFSEDFQASTPFWQALGEAVRSGNFWIPVVVICFAEWKIQDIFHVGDFRVSVWKSYIVGVLATYIASAQNLVQNVHHIPIAGTSIIAFSILLTYFVVYPIVAYVIQDSTKEEKDPRISNALFAAMFGAALLIFWQYGFANPSSPLHMEGLGYYVAIYLLLSAKSIARIKEKLNEE